MADEEFVLENREIISFVIFISFNFTPFPYNQPMIFFTEIVFTNLRISLLIIISL